MGAMSVSGSELNEQSLRGPSMNASNHVSVNLPSGFRGEEF